MHHSNRYVSIGGVTVGIQQLMWAIEGIRNAFHQAVYTDRDLDAALAALTDRCALEHVPAGTGGRGRDDVARHLAEDVLPHLPTDLTFRRVSRTTDKFRVVEETTVGFTFDRPLPWLLPGVAPTGRHAEVLAITVATFRHSRIDASRTRSLIDGHRTLWDHAGLAAQLGVEAAPATAAR